MVVRKNTPDDNQTLDLNCVLTQVPNVLRATPQWVVWKYAKRNGKPSKVPFNPHDGLSSDSTNPAKWSTIEVALSRYQKGKGFAGIGFILANGYCGIDLDNCINPDTGEVAPHAIEIGRQLASYTEVSPSGNGLPIFCKAKLPGKGLNRVVNGAKYEIYDAGRFFTCTGNHLTGTPKEINERQFVAESLYHWIKANSEAEKESNREAKRKSKWSAAHSSGNSNSAGASLSDSELMEIALNAANGAKFERLWSGDRSDYADSTHLEGNPSRADAALVMILCFYSQDDSQVERLWKESGLYRDKLERVDYVSRTIANARTYQTDSYSAQWSAKSKTLNSERISDIEIAASEMDDIILLMIGEYEAFGEEEKLAMPRYFPCSVLVRLPHSHVVNLQVALESAKARNRKITKKRISLAGGALRI